MCADSTNVHRKVIYSKQLTRNPMSISTMQVGHLVGSLYNSRLDVSTELSSSQEHLAVKGFFKW